MSDAETFDALHHATSNSVVYREAVRASLEGLPDWLVPFSIVDLALLERIATRAAVCPNDTIVDVACGTGGAGLWLAERTGASIVGCDIATRAVAAATRLAERRGMTSRARYVVADACALPMPDASASIAVSIDALMFIDGERAARELARVLVPGGRVVCTAAESLVEPFLPTLVRDYRPIFEAAGFRILVHEIETGHETRQRAFYTAIDERADRLLAEIGPIAESLIEEARSGLAAVAAAPRRVRNVLFAAERREHAFDH